MAKQGSLQPCGDAATADLVALQDLPFTMNAAPYSKPFEILPFPGRFQSRAPFPRGQGSFQIFQRALALSTKGTRLTKGTVIAATTKTCHELARIHNQWKRPRTHYAKCDDLNIACQITGDGPIDLVHVPGWESNLDFAWENPAYANVLNRLGSFARLIRFDKRGTGLSDREVGFPTLERRVEDERAGATKVCKSKARNPIGTVGRMSGKKP